MTLKKNGNGHRIFECKLRELIALGSLLVAVVALAVGVPTTYYKGQYDLAVRIQSMIDVGDANILETARIALGRETKRLDMRDDDIEKSVDGLDKRVTTLERAHAR